ncbi:BREX system serine/threonine kinase PglW [Tessaracoccus sp. MC1679]|uniref:BREX system serine/threonine kinase PglW n=1 Tax=Tessaracoccus sp. MC1679 TaxID=2760313 RepID=UPI0016003234|nr:BREX system serine/threonine kinase PglW [Tessaracoccus sp. MC1679]
MNDRWVEVTPSQFAHEAEGLRVVRDLLPPRPPFRAWTNFEFRDDRGTWSEVDLLLLAPDGLHLVELKYYSGRLRGDDQTWLRDGHAPEDSPLRLANRKAKRLRSKLMRTYDDWKRGRRFQTPPPPARDVIPFIHEAVFLHHPNLTVELPEQDRRDLYGLPDDAPRSGLAPITDLFTGTPHPGTTINEPVIAEIIKMIGLRPHKREAGSFVLDGQPLEDGPGWQDWLGTHKLLGTRRRIRFRTVAEGSPDEAHRRVRRIAEHEVRVMQHLSHDAVLRPEDFVDSELGPGLVYPYDPSWQRLDLWLAGLPKPLGFDDQLALVRLVAEALQYAHGRHVVHRGLNPRAVLVRAARDGRLHVKVGDWQGVGRIDEATSTEATRGVTQLADVLAGEVPTAERWARDAFTAPEGVQVGTPDRLRLDVFSLGALAFYLVTGGQLPARTRADLTARLREQQGLDVSVELPEVPPALREAILQATRPQVSERLPDVGAFLAALDQAATPPPEEVTDPLDAGPGALLGGRFELKSRLGAGSTAVGLLVIDLASEDHPERVLKVAVDDAAARRLDDEAEALRHLTTPRVARLFEGPIDVGGRSALLLASAGRETLATRLGNRERLSLDYLERWGIDLLETVVALDDAGVTHRDIKPANLGLQGKRGAKDDRAMHLVLFDFSLTKAAASDIQAGTRPYLDPFLSTRRQYDSAAERYAAAVVLFEMATGHPPVYGDGLSDPASIQDDATVVAAEFDPSAAAHLTDFFTRALARSAADRHDTAAQMLLDWRACFPASSVAPANADELAEKADEDTPLAQSGLTPRAVSGLEQLKVATVGDLAQVDLVRLARLPGVAVATREEIRGRAKTWRARFHRKDRSWRVVDGATPLPAPHDCADLLLGAARQGKQDRAVELAALLLGVLGTSDPNATQAELAAALTPPVTRARVSQLLGTIQERWASDSAALTLLTQLTGAVDQRLGELGGVATFDELARHLMSLMVAGPSPDEATHLRLAQGLLRCTMDREAARERAEGPDTVEDTGWLLRRREGRPLLVAVRHDLLDVAEALARRADSLVDETGGTAALVPAARAAEQLGAVLDQATPARAAAPYDDLREGHRLAHLAALVSQHAGASAVGELHHRSLSAEAALRYALPAVVPGQLYQPSELRERVQARFPQLPPMPQRPALDAIVDAAGRGLRHDDAARGYRAPVAAGKDTTGLDSRLATTLGTTPVATGPGAVGQRLLDSRKGRSFIALGVEAALQDRLAGVLTTHFDAVALDLTHTLMDALHATAAHAGLSWAVVLGADADQPGTRAHTGLRALVERSLPAVAAAIDETLTSAGGRPVALLDASLLARYDALGLLAGWMDLSTPRPTAVWLVVPQLHGNLGPMVDGHSLPLTAPNQYVSVPRDWISTHLATPVPEGHPA